MSFVTHCYFETEYGQRYFIKGRREKVKVKEKSFPVSN